MASLTTSTVATNVGDPADGPMVTGSPWPSAPADPEWPVVVPKAAPEFVIGADQQTYYSNLTIDDFSPLVVYSSTDRDSDDDAWDEWTTFSEDVRDDDDDDEKPDAQRQWGLGTYMRTENDQTRNGTIKLEFWGSEIYLYGDEGPAYGVYLLQVDDQTPTVHTAFNAAQATGRSHLLHSLHNLTDGRHELTITAGGGRPGLNEGSGFLFDYAVVRQKVGEMGIVGPVAQDVTSNGLEGLVQNGTWALASLQEDIQPGEGGMKPAIFISRVGLATADDRATLSHKFQGFAVQVYGGRNASHGAYRATLTDTTNNEVVHSKVYPAHAPCDVQNSDGTGTVGPTCDWRGSILKFAAADLDPSVDYDLTLQNLHQNGGTALEVDLIRVISTGVSNSNNSGTPGVGAGSLTRSSTGSESDGGNRPTDTSSLDGGDSGSDGGDTGAGRMNGIDPLTNLFVLFMAFVALWRSFKH